jgi:hypothetical protein
MSYKQNSPIPVTEGGTGLVTSTTAYAPICGGTTATGAFQAASTGLSTSGYVLTSNGAAALPSFQALPSSGITTINGDSGSVTGSTITFTGGTSGAVFTGSGSTMTESFNYLSLPTTTSTNGQVRINSNRFMHSYGTANTFLGESSGNFTLTGTGNTALGYQAFVNATSGIDNVAIGLLSMSGSVSGAYNVGVGRLALQSVTSGTGNIGVGTSAGKSITTASTNVAIGLGAMENGTGSTNIAISQDAMQLAGAASNNIAIGYQALRSIGTGTLNVAVGNTAGVSLTTTDSHNVLINNTGTVGDNNTLRIGSATGTGSQQLNKSFIHGIYGITAVGTTSSIPVIDSNGQLATGTPNSTTLSLSTDATSTTANLFTGAAVKTVTLGSTNSTSATTIQSGSGALNITSTNGALTINSGTGALNISSDASATTVNVATGAAVKTAKFGSTNTTSITTIQAGTGGLFTAGVRGVTTGVADAIAVLVDSAGQLGTVSSSIRYKENVVDMGDVSSPVLDLRPVTFDFIGKPSHKKQVGLIAEEVKEIMPSLVVHNQDGEVESVKYHELPILLLNELKKLRARVEELEAKIK